MHDRKKLTLDQTQLGAIIRSFHQHGVPLGSMNYKFGEMVLLGSGDHVWYFVYQPLTGKRYDEYHDPFIIQYVLALELSEVDIIGDSVVNIDYVHQVLNHYFKLGLK